jgi:hypothetical protein
LSTSTSASASTVRPLDNQPELEKTQIEVEKTKKVIAKENEDA